MTYEKLTQLILYVRWIQELDLDVFMITSAPKGFGKSSAIIQLARKYIELFGLTCTKCGHEWMFTGKCEKCLKINRSKLCKNCRRAVNKTSEGWQLNNNLTENCPKCNTPNPEKVKRIDFKKYLAYDNDDIENMIHTLPEYSPWMGDEGVRIMMGEDWMKSESKNMKRLFAQMRTKHLFGMVNIQKFKWVESKYRDDMTTFWLRIVTRGLSILLQPDLGEDDDTWHMKNFRELLGSYSYFTPEGVLMDKVQKIVNKHPCAFDFLKLPDVPDDIYTEYLKTRNEKAFERKNPDERIDQKQLAKVASWNLMNRWGEIVQAVKEGRFERPTLKLLEHHVFSHPKTREKIVGNTAIKYWVDDIQKLVEK